MPSAGHSQPRVKAKAAASVRTKAGDDQPFRPDAGLHQPLGREFLDERQDVAAGPVAARAARWRPAGALEAGQVLRALGEQGLAPGASPTGTRRAPGLDRAPQQGRLQVPVAEHRRGRAERAAVDQRHAGPAADAVDPLEVGMRLVVGNGGDRRLGASGQSVEQAARRARCRRRSAGSARPPRTGWPLRCRR